MSISAAFRKEAETTAAALVVVPDEPIDELVDLPAAVGEVPEAVTAEPGK